MLSTEHWELQMLTENSLSQHKHVGLMGSRHPATYPSTTILLLQLHLRVWQKAEECLRFSTPPTARRNVAARLLDANVALTEKRRVNAQNRGGRMPPTAPVEVSFLNDTRQEG